MPFPIRTLAVLAATTLSLAAVPAAAQDASYPDRPIVLVVPFPPGGTLDTAARIVANELEGTLGQPVIVDNRSGAGGNIGADFVAKSEPDGHTLLMGALSTHGINVSLYPDMPFDPVADFAPISLVATTPNVLVVGEGIEAASVEALAELARSTEGGLTYASGSSGSAGHLAGELLADRTGASMTHVPYRGSAAALQAVLAGEVDFIFDNLASASSHIGAGTVKALAVTTAERSAFAPDLPTMQEEGFEGFDITTWFGILAPAGTPETIVERLNADIRDALASDRFQEAMSAQGSDAAPSSPREFADFIESEIAKYSEIVRAADIRLE